MQLKEPSAGGFNGGSWVLTETRVSVSTELDTVVELDMAGVIRRHSVIDVGVAKQSSQPFS